MNSSRLTAEEVVAIRRCVGIGWRQVDVAARFGISQSHVSEIVNYHKWKTVSTDNADTPLSEPPPCNESPISSTESAI